ncbi:sulfite exporter TauE/SafE family protein [Aquamicrobium zhengzhouense]|uniref:Probable membrane transporter protein n=1 Tax=Aquamicrobium zhengzhouense TaxID=2781738 RepID=A0ABS0S9C9_9HYPH|nr:sulfite exporter TauE/SafE family protein [Aquamicrobium zhengzhouense]MBI1619896.1 sulfite exporter TauE/SafE family protein [Aquamicrobium zhengzhouense]
MLNLTSVAALAAFVCISSYLQTVTGFAFALIFMSAIATTNVIGFEDGAMIATLLMLVNATMILASERQFVARRAFIQIVPLALAGTVVGAFLLPGLLASSAVWLKFALGVAVIVSSLRLLRIPKDDLAPPQPFAFPLSGLASGIMGGLFAVPGPPIVYALQRYLADQREIRATLVAIFAAISVTRVISSSISGLPTAELIHTTLILVPATILSTEAARRWPPPLSPYAARMLTVSLLVLTGAVLMLPAFVPIK